jgi:hypothetical protein
LNKNNLFQFGRQFLSQLYQCILMENNTKEIFYVIYSLMCLVTLEAGGQDVLVDVIHFCFEIQVNLKNKKSFLLFIF